MVILHIAPNAPYNVGWGYQENILPKFHHKMGHDVVLLTTCKKHQDGSLIDTDEIDYIMDDGVRLIRRKQQFIINATISNYIAYIKIKDVLEEIHPDYIFFHGLISYSIVDVVRYIKKNPGCIAVQDNHMDYNIGFRFKTYRKKILRSYYRLLNRYSIKYISKVYGVTPWRKQYAEDYFKIPTTKTDVLVMGADDDKLCINERDKKRKLIRDEYGIEENDFLIVTGGKIDKKKNIEILAKAVKNMKTVKLLIFGSIAKECESSIQLIINNAENIIYIGWIEADKVYDYFFAADLVFFPGQHSVLWEQACACKVPCVFEKWEGMDHVDVGGNCSFLFPVTEESVRAKVEKLLFTEEYWKIKEKAESSITDSFMYSKIAEKSLECLDEHIS